MRSLGCVSALRDRIHHYLVSMAGSARVEDALEHLVQALRAHASAVQGSTPDAIGATAETVRVAAASYEDTVFDQCGAGSVFSDLGEL